MPIPSNFSKKQVELADNGAVYHIKRPDLDNLCKLVMDAMNGIFWQDDKQIAKIMAFKTYSKIPRTHIKIVEIHNQGEQNAEENTHGS